MFAEEPPARGVGNGDGGSDGHGVFVSLSELEFEPMVVVFGGVAEDTNRPRAVLPIRALVGGDEIEAAVHIEVIESYVGVGGPGFGLGFWKSREGGVAIVAPEDGAVVSLIDEIDVAVVVEVGEVDMGIAGLLF